MSIEAIRSLIADFGLSVSISAIFIFIAWKFIKNTIDQNNKMMKLILDERQNQSPAVQQQKHKELIDLRLEVNNKIKVIIDAFRNSTNADRVFVFEYHNGESNLNGLPFAKVSATYEVLQFGVPSYKVRLQSIPSGLILEFNQKLLKEGHISARKIEDYKTIDPTGCSVLVRPDVKSFYVHLMKDTKGCPLGFIGMDYIVKESTEEQEKKALDALEDCANKISSLLEINI